MARALLERQLTRHRGGNVRFEVANRMDDADLRRLLRSNPMAGRISLTLEREPNYFADASLPGERKETILARESGRVVCVGSCTVRQRFVNGLPRRVGYLGGLRLDAEFAGRFDIIRRGYEFFHERQAASPAEYYFTTIVSDNLRAQRLLERNLPGMPKYEFIGELVTLLLPVRRWRIAAGSVQAVLPGCGEPEIVGLLNQCNRQYQFAPCWTTSELAALSPLGFQEQGYYCVRRGSELTGVGALWDQRSYKQTVVRSYDPWLALLRPALNLAARCVGSSRLPAPGETLPHAFLSHLALASGQTHELVRVVKGIGRLALERKIAFLTMTFATEDPRLATMRTHFRAREYRSRLYTVHWSGMGGAAGELDKRPAAPEGATL